MLTNIGDSFLNDRFEIAWCSRLDPLGHLHLILLFQGEITKFVHLLVRLALQEQGHVGLDFLHVPTRLIVVGILLDDAAGFFDLGGLG